MGLIREPKDVDFIIHSKPWTDRELSDFRKIMESKKKKQHQKLKKQYA